MDSINTPAGAAKALAQITQHLRERAGLSRKAIDMPDGTRYVYLEGGEGEPLFLLHGFGANKDHFVRVAEGLTGRYRVILPDHIGFGESTADAGLAHDAWTQAGRLAGLANALGLQQYHVGGSSMGGHIAMMWAAAQPEAVLSLWLLNPGGVWSGPKSEMRQRIEATGKVVLIARTPAEYKALLDAVVFKPAHVPEAMIEAMAAPRIASADLETQIFFELGKEGVEARVNGLKTPTLVVWGREDRIIHHGCGDILTRLMPNAQLILIDEIGHVPALECPERVVEDYIRFRSDMPA
ncbi:alpha/beta fold hydrolase [Hydrogenophaga sp. 5NK40-0174]|uniref:alpha/beta fold hydrolase n=1 Tax=Hydrogenophaga sp. 5NK40-0174 TaxID=3127649 RepID=UPI00310A4886